MDLRTENKRLKEELGKRLDLGRVPASPPRRVRHPKGKKFKRYIVIPDTQCKPGVPLDHLTWAGKYIRDERPDVVVHLGDHWDFESLSSYDKGKKCFEGRRYKADVEAGNRGMDLLTREYRSKKYSPEQHFLFGNHEDRVTRTLETEPWLEGTIGFQNLNLDGWTQHPFLEVVKLDGTLFCHYFYNPMNSRPWSGSAESILKNVGGSFVQGHRQGLVVSMRQLPTGGRHRGIVCGSFYQHDEKYLGPQGNHWRGILVLNEVRDGDFDVVEVSLDYLRRKYGRD